jgi:predicted nucleic acid-binding protein
VSVLVDTSALFALVGEDDDAHDTAVSVVETTALIQNRLGMAWVRTLHDELLPAIETRWIDSETHAAALTALLAADARRVSFVDRVSFEVMRRDGIEAAFAFDKDFASQGFRTIPA